MMFEHGSRVAIVGSGEVGKNVRRTLKNRLDSSVLVKIFDSDPRRAGRVVEGDLVSSVNDLRTFAPSLIVAGFSADDVHYDAWCASMRLEFGVAAISALKIFEIYPEMRGWPLLAPTEAVGRRDEVETILTRLSDEVAREQFNAYFKWVCREKGVSPIFGRGEDQYINALTLEKLSGAVVLDGGAYSGDTLKQFIEQSNASFTSYHAVEPDPASFSKLTEYISTLPSGIRAKCSSYQMVLSATSGLVAFENFDNQMSRVVDSGIKNTASISISDLASSHDVSPTFIKLDLEGAELAVLRAELRQLQMWRPTICVAIYHNPSDFIEIPSTLISALSDYRFYVRSHNRFGLDFVFYALPY
jgi:FkbM family methyltransferase